ncbi:hypothetical protein JYB87_02765 [Shewanella avicenniae]|uniref:Porin n=1 Tax=Shewanella avicenniae TaxID=2814294 RepID=A0ABX7QRW3_9GAMM|nr:hypothetical protein [Shewanella avicenniae]QSX34188.1 hypothetical protein JYB87_02765 [Shewanella avicenniae]
MLGSRIQWLFAPLLLAATLSGSVLAAGDDAIQFRGFATLSAAYSDSASLGFRRDMTQEGKFQQWSLAQDSAFGLQADVKLAPDWQATVQLVAKSRDDYKLLDNVELAFVSYEPNNNWRIRAGRIGSDLTMIGDVGNVGYAYDWVRPPVEFYGAIPFYHFDGIEVNHKTQVASGYLHTKVFYGKSDSRFIYAGTSSDFDLQPFWGAGVQFEKGAFTFRAAYLNTKLSNLGNEGLSELSNVLALYAAYPGVSDTLDALNIDTATQYYTSGISYRFANWSLLAEASLLDSEEPLLPSTFAAYTGIVRRIDNVAVYGLLGHVRSINASYQVSQMVPEPLYSISQSIFDGVDLRQSTASVGVRWDFRTDMALKLQWDHSWVTENKAMLWRTDSFGATPDEQVNVFTLSVSLVF